MLVESICAGLVVVNDQIQEMGRLINGVWLGKGGMISGKDTLVLLINYKDICGRMGVGRQALGGFCRKTTKMSQAKKCGTKRSAKYFVFFFC